MGSNLVSVLHLEERPIVAELRASKAFQRLEAIRRLLALYDPQPSFATGLDAPQGAEPDRASGEVIHLASAAAPAPLTTPTAVTAKPAPTASTIALAGPAPKPAPAPRVAAVAEAAVANVAMRAPAPAPRSESETSSVVSSVRAALLGIGKGRLVFHDDRRRPGRQGALS
ncbi:hypothetical protein [Neoroseomonas lacus]|uniref:Uncharacterized protein n=1 Tax=Neoroseomonas lacus TaxID=287609 RepID=A0A917NG99_9PROT|nr:hypothetical protein [Neoroseomonas lacus]GGI98076.1 hypothetical protein GCM10011320_01060 [Neoroseomonas lacus]